MLLELDFPNIDPIAIRLGFIDVRWYGLGYLVGFLIAYAILTRAQKKGYLRLTADDVSSFLMCAIIGTFAGGRLGYLIFYDDYFSSGRFFEHPLELVGVGPEGFSGVRGLSFHGGLAGVILAGSAFVWWRACRHWKGQTDAEREPHGAIGRGKYFRGLVAGSFDAAVLAAPAGIFLVRMANFINGELYGRFVTDTSGKPVTDAGQAPGWAMRFPTGATAHADRGELYDFYSSVLVHESFNEGSKAAQLSGQAIDDAARNLSGELPVNPDYWDMVRAAVPLRHPSQIYQGLTEGLLVLVLLWLLRKRLPKRGMLAGTFLMAYALCRIPMEAFRQPDDQFGSGQKMDGWGAFLAGLHLTQGQLLSIAMGLAGLAMFVICARSKNPFMRFTSDELAWKAAPYSPPIPGAK